MLNVPSSFRGSTKSEGMKPGRSSCSVISPCIATRQKPSRLRLVTARLLRLSDELGMRPLQAHCHFGLGNNYVAMGSGEQARAELSSAIDLFRSMDMTNWLDSGGGRVRKHIVRND